MKSADAVGARQDADLGEDRTDGLQVAAVDADAAVEDVAADDLLLDLLEDLADELRGRRVGSAFDHELGEDLRLDRVDRGVALGLAGERVGDAEIVLGDLADAA